MKPHPKKTVRSTGGTATTSEGAWSCNARCCIGGCCERRHLSPARIFIGFVVISIGIVVLGQQIGFLPDVAVQWLQLWPVIIIAIGLSMLPNRTWVSVLLSGIMAFVAVVLVGALLISAIAGVSLAALCTV